MVQTEEVELNLPSLALGHPSDGLLHLKNAYDQIT